MPATRSNRFDDFFQEGQYLALKNHLYNYLLRKDAIEAILTRQSCERILEIGSGVSPVMTKTDRIVYSELSARACRTLRAFQKRGWYVTTDATHLPFKDNSFSHVVCSEVLEHVENDEAVVAELSRVLRPNGRLVLTFPHRKQYFANDDRYVNHLRRYELCDIERLLEQVKLHPKNVVKVLGPLEKILMMGAVVIFDALLRLQLFQKYPAHKGRLLPQAERLFLWSNTILAMLVATDARLMPQKWATCLLVEAVKE